jgi:hypothetical protein
MIQSIVKSHPQIDKLEKNYVYQMKCMDCPLKFIGQTGRTFYIRYKEHIRKIGNNNGNSGYLNHTLGIGHTWEYN